MLASTNRKIIFLAVIVAIAMIFIPAKTAGTVTDKAPPAPEALAEVPEPANGVATMIVESTAYTHTGHMTYTGTWPRVGTIAVDPKVIPLGSIIEVPGYGIGIAEDTGGLIKGEIIDLFMETEKEAFKWGRRLVKIRVILPEDGR